MNLETLKGKTLDDETFAKLQAYVEDLTGARDAAKQESIDGRKKLKAEVEQLRAVKATLFEKLGLDDETDLDNLPEVKGQADAVKQFEAKMKRLEREKADALAKAGEVEGKWKSSRLDAALAKAVGAIDFINPARVAQIVSADVQWEDDQIMYRNGDKLMPLEDGIKLIAQTDPYLLKAQGRTGSGSTTGAGSSGGKSTMTRADFEALPPAAKVEAAKSGVQLT